MILTFCAYLVWEIRHRLRAKIYKLWRAKSKVPNLSDGLCPTHFPHTAQKCFFQEQITIQPSICFNLFLYDCVLYFSFRKALFFLVKRFVS